MISGVSTKIIPFLRGLSALGSVCGVIFATGLFFGSSAFAVPPVSYGPADFGCPQMASPWVIYSGQPNFFTPADNDPYLPDPSSGMATCVYETWLTVIDYGITTAGQCATDGVPVSCGSYTVPRIWSPPDNPALCLVAFRGWRCNGFVANFDISPYSHDFGNVVYPFIGTPQTVTITNNTPIAVSGCTVSLTSPNATDFTLSGAGSCTSLAASGGSCSVTVNAAPQSAGSKSTKVHMVCTGGWPSTLTVDSGNYVTSVPVSTPTPSLCGPGKFHWDTQQSCVPPSPSPSVTLGCRCPGPGSDSGCWEVACDSATRCCPCPLVGSTGWYQLTSAGQATCTVSTTPTPTPTPTPTATPTATPTPTPSSCSIGTFPWSGLCETTPWGPMHPACYKPVCIPGNIVDQCCDCPIVGSADWNAMSPAQQAACPAATPTATPTASPGGSSPFPSATPCHLLGDTHATDCDTCAANYVRVARPFPAPPPVRPTPFRVQSLVWVGLQGQIQYAQQKRDYQFIKMLKPVMDAVCPSADAANIACPAGETCEKDIFNFCDSSLGVCSNTVTYADGGASPPGAVGCTAVSTSCSVTIACGVWSKAATSWATDTTNYKRNCTVTDTCFTGDPQTCAPFNRFAYTMTGTSASDGTQLTNMLNNADMMCIPDCERFDGTGFTATASGLSYVWSGSNAGACACAQGYVFNTATKQCVSPTLLTGCDAGSANVPPSPVSPEVTGGDYAARFTNTRNKKMACCLNGLENNAAMAKFDCVDNSTAALPDFNTLWASKDAAFGGQLNAIELTGVNGKLITGWYSLAGKRADQFSEFTTATIQPGIINAKADPGQIMHVSGTQKDVGSAIPMPSGAAWTALITARQSAAPVLSTSIPTTIDDKLKYPLLVRAAAVYTCPKNAPVGVKTPLRQVTSSGTVICPVATSIAIHLRVEQIWQVAGTPPFKTIDTVLDRTQMSGISIDQIMGDKYGPGCAPGTFQQGDACAH
ncbi:MAG: hypothetical protein JST80_06115 [Bdellovibrionales bacterium]|nr:hypothetical protein [Bdellovibrionales bacterium]